MKIHREISDVELPTAELADMVAKAAAAGVSTAYFIGIQALSGAYGFLHPDVVEFRNRANLGISGPQTQEGE